MSQDPRWGKFGQNLVWFLLTVIALTFIFRYSYSFIALLALWGVGLGWGGLLAYRLSQIVFGADPLAISDERSQASLKQARDYKRQIQEAIDSGTVTPTNLEQMSQQVDTLVEAIEALVERIGAMRQNELLRRDLQSVPQAIKDLEARLLREKDPAMLQQLERTLTNRRQQLEALTELQLVIQRAEVQIESTLSQLGTIYSQLLTGQSTSQVADYSRLSADVDEEVKLLEDRLQALREVKLGSE